MSDEMLQILGLISMLPEEDQKQVETAYFQIKSIIETNGNNGILALTKIAMQIQEKL
jgi:hypothetical protein